MSSETSSEININYLDNKGNKLLTNGPKSEVKTEMKRQTSDTDYYFDMVANKDKIMHTVKVDSDSDLDNIINSSESKKSKKSTTSSSSSSSSSSSKRSSSAKPQIEKINLGGPSKVNTSIPYVEPSIPTYTLSPQEIRMKKIELLRRLSEIKSKGYQLTKEYDFNSSIEEMEYEYALLKSFADKRNGTKLYKSILLNGISLVEFANDKYDPFDFKLSGWSEHMSVEIDSYDDIIEELYEKYKSTGKSTPAEVRLILLLFASGAAFHFSKTQLGGMPGISTAATGMLNKMMAPPKNESKFMSAQEINLENQKQALRERDKQLKQQTTKTQQPTQQPVFQPSIQPLQQSFQQTTQKAYQSVQQNNQEFQPVYKSASRDVPEIRAPENVQDILSRIKKIQQNNNTNINTTDTQEETSTNNDRLVSDSTLSESKKRGRKPKKPIISINTN
uniref:Uncharacterized protein n=1 Tax=viral metagenome TaxID=1070528 RepID=A0A6C0DAJ3_9ZZZZ